MPHMPAPADDRPHLRMLIALVAVAIALRLLLFAFGPAGDVQRAWQPDTVHYVTMAQNLRTSGTLGLTEAQESGLVHVPLFELRRDLGQLETPDEQGVYPSLFRTPGYSAALVAAGWVTDDLRLVLILQCLVGGTTAGAVYLLTLRFLGRRSLAAVAAAVAAANPASVLMDNQLLSESLFVASLIWGLALIVLAGDRRPGRAVCGGLLLGLATLTRPIGLAAAPLVALYLVAQHRSRRSVLVAAAVVVLALGPAAAWVARNHAITGRPIISTVPTINAWYYTAAYIDAAERGADTYRDWPATVKQLHAELRAAASPDEDVFVTMQRLAAQRIAEHPATYARLMADSVLKFFTDHSVGALAHMLGLPYRPMGLRDQMLGGAVPWQAIASPAGFAVAASGWNALLALALPVGLAVLLLRRRWAAALLLGALVGWFVLGTQVNGLERFRLPIVGLQAIAVGAAAMPLLALAARFRRRRSGAADSAGPDACDVQAGRAADRYATSSPHREAA